MVKMLSIFTRKKLLSVPIMQSGCFSLVILSEFKAKSILCLHVFSLTTMQAFSNMEARAKWAKGEQKRMSEKAKYVQKPRYEMVETNDGNAFKMSKKTGTTPESTP